MMSSYLCILALVLVEVLSARSLVSILFHFDWKNKTFQVLKRDSDELGTELPHEVPGVEMKSNTKNNSTRENRIKIVLEAFTAKKNVLQLQFFDQTLLCGLSE